MPQEFHAIYEHGVLRPLTPLNLPECAEVSGVLNEKPTLHPESLKSDPLIGLMSDIPELMDEIVAEAMVARTTLPFRVNE
jgi:predicted DNA-binding antitoxin AbrB/MazE fold protein